MEVWLVAIGHVHPVSDGSHGGTDYHGCAVSKVHRLEESVKALLWDIIISISDFNKVNYYNISLQLSVHMCMHTCVVYMCVCLLCM